MKKQCRETSILYDDCPNVLFQDSLPYGDLFFNFIDECDCLLVPNLYDEQPRIVFDGACRGVPVIASNTKGIREIVVDGETGFLHRVGNADDLADLIASCAADPESLRDAGLKALENLQGKSHENMHLNRAVKMKESGLFS